MPTIYFSVSKFYCHELKQVFLTSEQSWVNASV